MAGHHRPRSTCSATGSASASIGALPLTAEITVAALVALDLRPGDAILAAAKATDINAYPA